VRKIDKKTSLVIVVTLLIGLFAGYLFAWSRPADVEEIVEETETTSLPTETIDQNQGSANQTNRNNCLADECLLVEGLEYPIGSLPRDVQIALDEALNDEYKALATYEAVIDKFGSVRPFSMIKGAEEQHIASLKAIYDKYGLKIPENTWLGQIAAPDTLSAACQLGVEAEIANASLYEDDLLPVVTDYEDITVVFESLMMASVDKHLPAFENCN
jgi:hypothetical protein